MFIIDCKYDLYIFQKKEENECKNVTSTDFLKSVISICLEAVLEMKDVSELTNIFAVSSSCILDSLSFYDIIGNAFDEIILYFP